MTELDHAKAVSAESASMLTTPADLITPWPAGPSEESKSDPLRFTWESTPAVWACWWDPEGPCGYGKSREKALGALIESCDDDHFGPLLLEAIVAAISPTSGVGES
jgi:hypothetical protein